MQRSFTMAALAASVAFAQAQRKADLISQEAWISYLDRDYSVEVANTASKKPKKDKKIKIRGSGSKSPKSPKSPKSLSLKAQVALLQQEVLILAQEAAQRDILLGTQGTDIDAAEVRLDTAESDIDALEVTQGTQGTAITTNANDIDAAESDIDDLEATQGTQGTAITTNANDIDAAESDIDALEVTQGTQGTAITGAESDIDTLQTDLDAAEETIATLVPLLPIESYFYTNPDGIRVDRNEEETLLTVDLLDGETIEFEANVCVRKGSGGGFGHDAKLFIKLNSSADATVQSNLANRQANAAASACGAISWESTVTEDTTVELVFAGSTVTNTEMIISPNQLQLSYSIFNTDYDDVTNPLSP